MVTPPSPPGGPDNGNAHADGADCPPETEYLLSDNRENVSSCYVEAGA